MFGNWIVIDLFVLVFSKCDNIIKHIGISEKVMSKLGTWLILCKLLSLFGNWISIGFKVSKFVSVERKTINILAYMVKCLELRMEPT